LPQCEPKESGSNGWKCLRAVRRKRVYHPVGGGTINGTRRNFGPEFRGNAYQLDIGNSAYHAFESTLRHVSGRMAFLMSYTFSKSIDDGFHFRRPGDTGRRCPPIQRHFRIRSNP